jgi:hypothetical protein
MPNFSCIARDTVGGLGGRALEQRDRVEQIVAAASGESIRRNVRSGVESRATWKKPNENSIRSNREPA